MGTWTSTGIPAQVKVDSPSGHERQCLPNRRIDGACAGALQLIHFSQGSADGRLPRDPRVVRADWTAIREHVDIILFEEQSALRGSSGVVNGRGAKL